MPHGYKIHRILLHSLATTFTHASSPQHALLFGKIWISIPKERNSRHSSFHHFFLYAYNGNLSLVTQYNRICQIQRYKYEYKFYLHTYQNRSFGYRIFFFNIALQNVNELTHYFLRTYFHINRRSQI